VPQWDEADDVVVSINVAKADGACRRGPAFTFAPMGGHEYRYEQFGERARSRAARTIRMPAAHDGGH